MTQATIFSLLIPCPAEIKPVAVVVVHFLQLLGTACTGVRGQGAWPLFRVGVYLTLDFNWVGGGGYTIL